MSESPSDHRFKYIRRHGEAPSESDSPAQTYESGYSHGYTEGLSVKADSSSWQIRIEALRAAVSIPDSRVAAGSARSLLHDEIIADAKRFERYLESGE